MPVFLVIPSGNDSKKALRKRIEEKFPGDSIALPDDCAFFVRFEGSSIEFSERLDLAGAAKHNEKPDGTFEPCFAFVTNLGIYSGYAPNVVWEWIKQSR